MLQMLNSAPAMLAVLAVADLSALVVARFSNHHYGVAASMALKLLYVIVS